LKRDGRVRVAKALHGRGGRGGVARGGTIDQDIARVRQHDEIVLVHIFEQRHDGGILGPKAIKVRTDTNQRGGHSRQCPGLFHQVHRGRIAGWFRFVDQNLNGWLLLLRLCCSKELRLSTHKTKQEG
jgi:hypothetical protein